MKPLPHTRSSVRILSQRIAAMKKSTFILLTAAASLLSGCDSSKIDGVNPTAPPAKLVQAGWKSSWSPDGRQLVHGTGQGGWCGSSGSAHTPDKRIDRLYNALGPHLAELEESAAQVEKQQREEKALALERTAGEGRRLSRDWLRQPRRR